MASLGQLCDIHVPIVDIEIGELQVLAGGVGNGYDEPAYPIDTSETESWSATRNEIPYTEACDTSFPG